jgi:hypothetical protein
MNPRTSRLKRVAGTAVLTAALLSHAGPSVAQSKQPPTPMPGSPPPAERIETPSVGNMEGALKRVDAATSTVRVASGPFGLFGRTLGVTPSTRIQVEGRDGRLGDLREGAKVKASYEVREGKSVATQIDVMPPEASERQTK